jgi:hypothetical protein
MHQYTVLLPDTIQSDHGIILLRQEQKKLKMLDLIEHQGTHIPIVQIMWYKVCFFTLSSKM